jgi:hypothetical protein
MVLRGCGCYHGSSALWQRPECYPACQVKTEILFKIQAYVTVVKVSATVLHARSQKCNLLVRFRKVKMALLKKKI